MRFALLLSSLGALGYGAASLLASWAALWAWRRAPLRARLARDSHALFALRLFPTGAALAFVAGLLLPAFLRFEPAATQEKVGPLFAALALFGSLPLAAGLWRGLRAARASRAFVRGLDLASNRVALAGAGAPAFAVAAPRVGIAVAGFFRARLLLDRELLETLSPDELAAVVAHENLHVARRDNLRRWLLRAAPDWLAFCGPAREIERAFADAAEAEADTAAVRDGRPAALALASALVRVARSMPRWPDAALASGLHSASGGALRRRVLALTSGAPPAPMGRRPRAAATAALLLASLGLAFAQQTSVLLPVHGLVESVVQALL